MLENILIVDDHPANLVALEAILQPLGQRVVKATSGEQALELLLDEDFACILLDVQMPGLDGFETAERIKQRPQNRHVPLLFLSAVAREEAHILRGYGIGAVDYLVKPYSPELLRAKVSVFVDLHRRAAELKAQEEALYRRRLELESHWFVDTLESISDGFMAFASDWTFTHLNTLAARVLGRSRAELLGKKLWEEFPELESTPFGQAYRRAMEERVPVQVEDYYPPFKAWFEARAFPTSRGLSLFFRDITERKVAEAERAELLRREQDAHAQVSSERKWLEAVLHLMPTPLLFIEPGTARVMFANKAADRLAGGEFPKEKPGPEYHLVYYCTDARGERIPDEQMPGVRAARGERLSGFEMDWHTPLGVTSIVLQSETLEAMYGHPRTVVLSFQEVTALKRAQREAHEAVRLRDEFLSVASHELRTPLTPLQLKLQQLRREAQGVGERPRAALVRDLELAEAQVRRLAALVNELLDVSRLSGARLSLTLEEVDLVALAREVAQRFEPQAERAGCRLRVSASHAVVGVWDRLRADQVLTNLLSNALKYGAGKPIHVQVEADGERARLVVRDEGIGIEPQALGRIFGKFERAVSERHYGGLGLGLYLARQIVEAMGGSVRAESTPGHGATFTVELPLRRHAPGAR